MKQSERKIDLEKLKDGVFLATRGGGIRSCAAIGTLKALEEANIPVKGVSGESLSSIFAVLLAKGYNSDKILDLFLRYNKVLTKASSLYGGRGSIVVEEEVNNVTDHALMKDLGIDCYVNSCYGSYLNPKLFLFSKEDTPNETVGTACRTSASLPIFYGKCKKTINGKEYKMFDGGFLYNPYIPSTDLPIIYASFYNDFDYYQIVPFLKKTIDRSNSMSDIIINAPIGNIQVIGSNDDMMFAAESGYKEAQKVLRK